MSEINETKSDSGQTMTSLFLRKVETMPPLRHDLRTEKEISDGMPFSVERSEVIQHMLQVYTPIEMASQLFFTLRNRYAIKQDPTTGLWAGRPRAEYLKALPEYLAAKEEKRRAKAEAKAAAEGGE